MPPKRQGYLNLQQLLATYHPPYAQTWEKWFTEAREGVTNDLVERLMEEYLEAGDFQEPVILSPAEQEFYEGEWASYPARVCNGMHRLAALERLGATTVFVQEGYTSLSTPKDLYYYLEVTLSTPDDCDYFERFDDLSEVLSFRYSENHWVALGGGSASAEGETYDLECDFEVGEVDLCKLGSMMGERLASFCPEVQVTRLAWCFYSEKSSYEPVVLEECTSFTPPVKGV